MKQIEVGVGLGWAGLGFGFGLRSDLGFGLRWRWRWIGCWFICREPFLSFLFFGCGNGRKEMGVEWEIVLRTSTSTSYLVMEGDGYEC